MLITDTPSQLLRALLAMLTLCIVGLQAATATNVYAPVYHFNNGTVDSNKKCNTAEWTLIQTATGKALDGTGRMLLRLPDSNHRRLPVKCSDCGGKPLCLAQIGLGCALLGKRRRLTERHDQRGLTSNPCSSKTAAVDAALNKILPNVTASCRALLNAPRRVECAEYTKECDITGFTVVHASTQNKIAKLYTNGTATRICNSGGGISIVADTNFFLGSVTFTFNGKISTGGSFATETYVQANQPYAAFGKTYPSNIPLLTSAANELKPIYIGRTLFMGTYTISAFSQDNPTKGKSATFTVAMC